MAIDYEKKAQELRKHQGKTGHLSDCGKIIAHDAEFLRQFAAEVIRDEAKVMNEYDVTGTAQRYLERRAAEIEENASHE
jgi:hypothetical protein